MVRYEKKKMCDQNDLNLPKHWKRHDSTSSCSSDRCSICLSSSIMSSSESSEEENVVMQRFKDKVKSVRRKAAKKARRYGNRLKSRKFSIKLLSNHFSCHVHIV